MCLELRGPAERDGEVGTERRCGGGGGVGAREELMPAAVGLALKLEQEVGAERCMGACAVSTTGAWGAGALMFQPLERSTLGCKCSTK